MTLFLAGAFLGVFFGMLIMSMIVAGRNWDE